MFLVVTTTTISHKLTSQLLSLFRYLVMTDKPDTVDNPNEEEIVDSSQQLKDLQAAVAKLQAENASLRTSKMTQGNANQFVKNLTDGITQGISQAISTQIKPVQKNKIAKQPGTIELDPDLPQCYHDMQHQEKNR